MNALQCPDCRTPLAEFGPSCPVCALPLIGPTAHALWKIDSELAQFDVRRQQFLSYRESLLTELRSQRDRPVPSDPVSCAPHQPFAGGPARSRDLSSRSVQNLLLILGGILVGIAATVFTVVNWGRLGIGGRAAILLGLTVLALAAPWPLARRGLRASAEAVAGIGLVLTGLEFVSAYDLDLLGLGHTAPLWYAAAVTAGMAAVWAGYGRLAALRLPLPVSIVMAQFPPLLAAGAVGPTRVGVAAALIVAAGLDLAFHASVRSRPVRLVADICAGLTGGSGLVLVLVSSLMVGSSAAGWRAAAVLVLAMSVGLAYAWQLPVRAGVVVAGVAAVALTGGMVTPFVPLLPAWWLVTLYGAAGACVFAASQAALPARLRPGAVAVGIATVGATVLAVIPGTLVALLGPVAQAAAHIWDGTPRQGLDTEVVGDGLQVVPLVLAVGAVVAWAAVRGLLPAQRARMASWVAGAGIATAALATVPAAVDLACRPAVATLFVLAAVLIAAAASLRDAALGAVAGFGGLAVTAVATGWSLADRWATLAALGAALVMSATASAFGRSEVVRAGAAPVAVVAAAGLSWAGPLAIGYPARLAAFAVLFVGAAALALAGWDGGSPRSIGLEGAAVPVAVLALTLAAQRTWSFAAALALVTVASAMWSAVRHGWRQRAGAVTAVVSAGGATAFAGLAAGLPIRLAAFGVVAAAALSAGAAALVRKHDVARAIEPTGWVIGAAGVAMTASDASLLSISLALTGLIALGVSLRPDRRAHVWAGAVLMQLALWIRLGIAGVTTPEAYTLPIAAAALGFGLLRHRRSPTVTSWTTYGPGLTIALVPSLLTVWAEPGWIRPLLLGLGSAALAVAGARARLQAPLLLGGAVLILDAIHELTPVTQLIGHLPRWVPIAMIGLTLLFLGATYEHRRRDLRRLRDALTAMR